jgi:hypothetical protein
MSRVRGDQDLHRAGRPGWYGDPWRQSRQRYWDGARWTAATRPSRSTTVRRALLLPLAVVLAVLYVLVAGIV